MATRRSKRWNGELESLSVEFLKDVIERMELYGDSVQFELPGHAQRPHYQVTNARGYQMAFNSKNLLLNPNEETISESLSAVFTLGQLKSALVAPPPAARRTATRRSSSGVARAAAVPDTIESDKYQYFRTHRDTLPEGIQAYGEQVSTLMRTGLSAEAAFNQIVAEHFE